MKKIVLLVVLVYVAMLVRIVFAAPLDPLEIEVADYNISTSSDRGVNFAVTIKNNQETKDRYTLTVSGPHLEWKLPGDVLIVVGPETEKTTYVSFYPKNAEEDVYAYDITVSSYDTGAKATKRVYINILPEVRITGFYLDKSEDKVDVSVGLSSFEEKDAVVVINLIYGDKTLQSLEIPTTVDITKSITKTISLEDFSPGMYTIEVILNDKFIDSKTFEVEPVHEVIETKTTIENPLYKEIIIEFYNNGNVVEYNYIVSEGIQTNFLTGFITEPVRCIEGTGLKKCDFVIEELRPEETAKVIYRIEFWPTYGQYAGAIIVVIIMGILSFKAYSRPKLKKKHIKKSKEKHHISLEIKNPIYHMKNVVLRDWVSPLAKVLHEEFESVKPVIRKSNAGTELVWRLGNIKPKDERIISYKIQPLVKGSLKMPKAHLRYVDKTGNRIKIHSRGLVIE